MDTTIITKLIDKVFSDKDILLYIIVLYWMAKEPINAVFIKYFNAKFKSGPPKTIRDEIAAIRTQTKASQIRISREQFKTWTVLEYESSVIVLDKVTFYDSILEMVAICRDKKEKITFSFMQVIHTNADFIMAWEYAAQQILEDNNVQVTLVFPNNGSKSLESLYKSITETISNSNKDTITIRKDRRT